MATLTLTAVWINLLATGDAVSAKSAKDPGIAYDVVGDVRTYAGGRRRAITTLGERGSFSFELRDVTLPTIVTLRSWAGRPVQVRDHRGQLFVGVYFGVDVNPSVSPPTLYDVGLRLDVVTAEAVA